MRSRTTATPRCIRRDPIESSGVGRNPVASHPSAFLTIRCPQCGPVERRLVPAGFDGIEDGPDRTERRTEAAVPVPVTVSMSATGDDVCVVSCDCGTLVSARVDVAMSAMLVASGAVAELTVAKRDAIR